MANVGRVIMVIAEFVLWMASIGIGARLGGMCIGFMGGLGVGILVYGFQEPVGTIPFDVLQILMAVVCATAALETAGGLDVLVEWCRKLLQKHPKWITIVGPLVTWLMTVASGTGYVFLALMPVVAEVSRTSGVRPSKPLAVSVLASMYGVIASPISAAIVFMAELFEVYDRPVTYANLLVIMIPATLIGLLVTSVCTMKLGSDADYLKRLVVTDSKGATESPLLKSQSMVLNSLRSHSLNIDDKIPYGNPGGLIADLEAQRVTETPTTEPRTSLSPSVGGEGTTTSGEVLVTHNDQRAVWAVAVFFGSILISIVLSILSASIGLKAGAADAIIISLFAGAAMIVWVSGADAAEIPRTSVFASGMTAAMCILGVAWMGGTFMGAHMKEINQITGGLLTSQPWVLMILVWLFASLLFGQAATCRAMLPPAMDLGLNTYFALLCFGCSATLWLLSSAPAIIAAAQMDTTGSFRLGKYLVDHSCAIPGLIYSATTIAATAGIGYFVIGTD